jgi:hypothetical protein
VVKERGPLATLSLTVPLLLAELPAQQISAAHQWFARRQGKEMNRKQSKKLKNMAAGTI